MSESTPPLPPQRTPEAEAAALLAARRRLLRGGLGAAPVVMTLASRPVLAATNCATPSSFASINASRPNQVQTCNGLGLDYWRNPSNFSQWPAGFKANGGPNATTFASVFGVPVGEQRTLLQMLQLSAPTDRDAVAQQLVVSLLNVASGRVPATVMTRAGLLQIWSEFYTKGYYEPTAGIRWFANSSQPTGMPGVIGWLRSTIG